MERLRRMRKLSFAAIFLIVTSLAFPFTAPAVMAQATTGGLRGVVTDTSGAVVPDADLLVRNNATGIESRSKTNGEGLYSFPRLLPGTYTLTVEKQGFKRQEFQEVVVQVGVDQAIDGVLQPGLTTETVTITAGGEELIQKESVQVSQTFETRKVAELPSNIAGGGIDTLALLAPGVVPGFGNVNSNGTTLSVNGNRARSNNFTIDGQDNNDLSIGGPSFFVDNQDTVSEFQIITNNFSAEYGRNQGAIVNVVTKAGTNEFHGTASWFHRDRKNFDSRNNIEKRSGRKNPEPFLYNVYNGTLGGPIIRDRAFFFGSYQLVTGRSEFISRSSSPSIAAEEVSRLKAAFPGNAAIAALADFSPFSLTDFGSVSERPDLPSNQTVTIGGRSFRVAFPQRQIKAPFNTNEITARGDVKITDNHALWYRHLWQTSDNQNSLGGVSGFTGDIPVSSTHAGANFTSQISNTAVNEFRFAYSQLSVIFGGGCEGLRGCIPDPRDIGKTFPFISFSGLRSSGGLTLASIGPATNLPQGRVVTVYQFANNFSKTIGRHQIKVGADIRRLTNSVPFLPNVNGNFSFSSLAAIEQNRPTTVTLASGEVEIAYNETDQFYYFQDDWRIRDNLTLNLGVRYEYTGQPINTLHDISVERESNDQTALWRQSLPLEARTFPKIPADKNNIAPRLGFAWSPRFGGNGFTRLLFGQADDTVISGGYSVAYDPGFYNIMLNVSTSAPLVFLDTFRNPATGPVTFPFPSTPTGEAVQQFAASNNIVRRNTFDPRFLAQTIVSPDFHSPYSQQWSFRLQRQLNRNNVVEARYVGTRGVGLFQTLNRNPSFSNLITGFTTNVRTGTTPAGAPINTPVNFPGFPNLVPSGLTPVTCTNDPATPDNEAACAGRLLAGRGLVRSRENTANSIYHGLQTRYQGRVGNQLSAGVSYTFSKALDNASEIFAFFENAAPQHIFNIDEAERSYSGFDRRHALAINFIWDVPVFKNQEGFLGRTLGGWQLNGIYYLANGQRFTPAQSSSMTLGLLGRPVYNDALWEATFIGFDSFRPFYGNASAASTAVGISQVDAALRFGVVAQDINGFYSLNELVSSGFTRLVPVNRNDVRYVLNGPGAARIYGSPFGDVPRNIETGPRLNQLNLGVFKNIKIREAVRLQLRVDAFNALNHPSPGVGVVGGDRTPSIFLENAGRFFNRRDEMTFSRRVVQMGLKLVF